LTNQDVSALNFGGLKRQGKPRVPRSPYVSAEREREGERGRERGGGREGGKGERREKRLQKKRLRRRLG
jgi:hypothetical protein